jgi:hypothetical protein
VNVMMAPGVFGRSRLVASILGFTRFIGQIVSTLFLTLCFKHSRSNGFTVNTYIRELKMS